MSCHYRAESGVLRGGENWKKTVPARRRGRGTVNIRGGERGGPGRGRPKTVPRERRSTLSLQAASAKTDRRVIVVGDSLLMGTEGPICTPDPTHREVCRLPGTQVQDTTRKLPDLVHPSDCYPLVTGQAGSHEEAHRSLQTAKKDFRAVGLLVEGVGAQLITASILSGAVRDTECPGNG